MARKTQLFLAFICLASAVLGTSQVSAESSVTNGSKSQSGLDFRIVIPPVLRVLENLHPTSLPPADPVSGRISSIQRLVVVTTMPKGFCVDMKIPPGSFPGWSATVTGSSGTSITRSMSGHRLCAPRAGRYEMAIWHDFSANESKPGQLDWPVEMDFASI